MRSSASDLRNGCRPVESEAAPVCHTPVRAVSISGEPCTAVRCMWCSTARIPPSSSPPPARPGPPWTRLRQGRAVPGRRAGVVAVEEQHSAVEGRDAAHQLDGDRRVVRRDARHERPAAARHEVGRVRDAAVRDRRRHRAERLHLVHGVGCGIRESQHQRRHERPVARLADRPVGARHRGGARRPDDHLAAGGLRASRPAPAPRRAARSRRAGPS